jgi:glycine oxidase
MNYSQTTDILIIGGGVIGLSLARELHKKGAGKITILERGKAGQESSFAAAGILAPQAEAEKADKFFHFCSDSKNLYTNFAKQLLSETEVDIELDQNGTLYTAFSESDVTEIRRRFDWQKKSGLAVEHLTQTEARKAEPFVSPDVREALFFPNDWQVENRKLLVALQKYAKLNNIEIIENSEVRELLIENGKISGAITADKTFFAEKVVLTTGAWTWLIKAGENALPFVKPIRGQILSFRTAKRLFSKIIYSARGYIVPRFDGRVLVGATVEDVGFDKSLTNSGIDFLLEIALEISPSLANLQIFDKWAGLRPASADNLPILGAFPEIENLYVGTAHFRNGILLAPLTAKILADKIVENSDSEYLQVFSPQRFQTKKAIWEILSTDERR